MKKQTGVTMITVVIMVIVISIISTLSILSTKDIFKESKEQVLEKDRFLVETAVSKYSAKAVTGGVFSPANIEFPGIQNPTFDSGDVNAAGEEIKVKRNVGEDWYLLLKSDLENIGVEYVDENYLVNYKKNVVIPLSEEDNVFELIKTY